MTERKLVTLRTVDDLKPIEGADLIELAIIDGWQCVVKKGSFKVGDIAVYHEIDSFCPIHPRYEFLRKNCYRNVNGLGEGFRIKSIKLKGEISQGLLLPLSDFDLAISNELQHDLNGMFALDAREELLSLDLSKDLGVIKYDPPLASNLQGKARGNFPSKIRKTDQERVQNLKKYFEKEILGKEFEVTLKLDGTSMTSYVAESGYGGVCSRNLDLTLEGNDDNLYVKFAKDTGILDKIPSNYAVQGELMGVGIQGNRENLKDVRLFVFDIQDTSKERYLTPDERFAFFNEFLSYHPRIVHAPVINFSFVVPLDFTVDKFLEMANNTSSINNPIAEGIVFKRKDGLFSFKAISDRFLLSEKD